MQFHLNGFKPGNPELSETAEFVPVIALAIWRRIGPSSARLAPNRWALEATLVLLPQATWLRKFETS